MRFFIVEVLAWIGAIALTMAWIALGDWLFPETSWSKIAFLLVPAALILGDLIYMTMTEKDD